MKLPSKDVCLAVQTEKTEKVEPTTVTDENFGDLLIGGANEALAYVRGKGTARAVRRVRPTPA